MVGRRRENGKPPLRDRERHVGSVKTTARLLFISLITTAGVPNRGALSRAIIVSGCPIGCGWSYGVKNREFGGARGLEMPRPSWRGWSRRAGAGVKRALSSQIARPNVGAWPDQAMPWSRPVGPLFFPRSNVKRKARTHLFLPLQPWDCLELAARPRAHDSHQRAKDVGGVELDVDHAMRRVRNGETSRRAAGKSMHGDSRGG